jgi:hypothetical protein
MARGPSRKRSRDEKERRLIETLDHVITGPPYSDGLDPVTVARAALERLPEHSGLAKNHAKKLREGFDSYVGQLSGFRERIDPVADPGESFDPGNPDTVGRLVVIALLAQDRVPLSEIRPTYGSGVYAIYYNGAHPAYAEISNTETPIYVGKADPAEPRAATPREQGVRLFGRLSDHRRAIKRAEDYASARELPDPLRIVDFDCRRLVCATNAQLVAEKHLIEIFKPAWNSETKICFGISKHGDDSEMRRNKRSPWDVMHPGRDWANGNEVRPGMTAETIASRLSAHFAGHPPRRDVEDIMQLMLDRFRQVGRTSAEISEAAADSEEVEESNAEEARVAAVDQQGFDFGGSDR